MKGIRNPSKIRDEISFLGRWGINIIINRLKEIDQYSKNSEYGLVINWGGHVRQLWSVAEYPFLISQFIDRFDPIIITSQRLYNKKADDLEHLFLFGTRDREGPALDIKRDHENILLFASDPHNMSDWLYNYIYQNNIDFILSPYYDPFLYHLPDIDEKKLIHFPWAVPKKHVIKKENIVFKNSDKVYMTGASGGDIYKFRDWCRKQPEIVDYATSGHQNKVYTNEEYYRWLREFDSMVVAGAHSQKYQYLFAKYFEVPAAGSLLFAQHVEDIQRAGFNSSNCVLFNSKEEFKTKIEEYQNDPRSYMDKRRKGVELISSRHTVEDRINLVERIYDGNY